MCVGKTKTHRMWRDWGWSPQKVGENRSQVEGSSKSQLTRQKYICAYCIFRLSNYVLKLRVIRRWEEGRAARSDTILKDNKKNMQKSTTTTFGWPWICSLLTVYTACLFCYWGKTSKSLHSLQMPHVKAALILHVHMDTLFKSHRLDAIFISFYSRYSWYGQVFLCLKLKSDVEICVAHVWEYTFAQDRVKSQTENKLMTTFSRIFM